MNRGRITAVCIFALTLIGISGCARTEPVQKSPRHVVAEKQPPPQVSEANPVTPVPVEPPLLEGSGIAVWAKEFEGRLIEGLDGNLYEPYARKTIERIQRTLEDRGLYKGPVNGILDSPTMQSIFSFQKANYHLPRCGIPTPHTRKILQQGSHTDLSF
jgi:hypothetical protein